MAITNCCVQKIKGACNDEMEIIVGDTSDLIKSPMKFCFADDTTLSTSDASIDVRTLDELSVLPINQYVNISGKVKRVESPEEINSARTGTLTKQDIILADGTAAYRCVVWEKHVGQF